MFQNDHSKTVKSFLEDEDIQKIISKFHIDHPNVRYLNLSQSPYLHHHIPKLIFCDGNPRSPCCPGYFVSSQVSNCAKTVLCKSCLDMLKKKRKSLCFDKLEDCHSRVKFSCMPRTSLIHRLHNNAEERKKVSKFKQHQIQKQYFSENNTVQTDCESTIKWMKKVFSSSSLGSNEVKKIEKSDHS
jgi:hypothetical protein